MVKWSSSTWETWEKTFDRQEQAKVMLLHTIQNWLVDMTPHLWPYAIWAANEVLKLMLQFLRFRETMWCLIQDTYMCLDVLHTYWANMYSGYIPWAFSGSRSQFASDKINKNRVDSAQSCKVWRFKWQAQAHLTTAYSTSWTWQQ